MSDTDFSEKDKEILARIHSQQQRKQKQEKAETSSDNSQAIIADLQKQLDKANDKIYELSNKLHDAINQQSGKLSQQAVEDIIKGDDNSHFYKEYSFPVPDNHPIKFRIIAHAPSFIENIKIQNELNEITEGHSQQYGSYINFATAYAYFKVIGDDVPKWFFDTSNLYRTDILTTVFADYYDWYNSFRNNYYQF